MTRDSQPSESDDRLVFVNDVNSAAPAERMQTSIQVVVILDAIRFDHRRPQHAH